MTRAAGVLLLGLALGGAEPQAPRPSSTPSPTAVVGVRNPIELARPAETVVLSAAELRRLLSIDDVRRVHVREAGSGRELLTQAIDADDDGTWDELVFQVDLGPKQARELQLSVGERAIPRPQDFRAYGRFVRERRDDFAWENDRVAHRMYGAALETWAQEPLTSSAVDVWCKRTRRLVVNEWYMVDDYHRDTGEGADFYSAGRSRGCGGTGLWVGGRLYPSANFRGSRVLANGPIRVMFELLYEAWDAGGIRVSEVKRVTLDAGQSFNRFESRYAVEGGPRELRHAIGIKKSPGSTTAQDRARGFLRSWEPIRNGEQGHLGCAVVLDPSQLVEFAEADGNFLVVARVPQTGTAVYHSGSGWDRSGDFAGSEDWDRDVEQQAARLAAPLEVTLRRQEKP